jgi:hypothetical protein
MQHDFFRWSSNILPVKQVDVGTTLKSFAAQRRSAETTILCLYTGDVIPQSCTAMPLDPTPPSNWILDEDFSNRFSAALQINYAVHDGAIMCRRAKPNQNYVLSGWSFRLFPPQPDNLTYFNRGSAFHSCLAMSLVPSVDHMYLVSGNNLLKFRAGEVETA